MRSIGKRETMQDFKNARSKIDTGKSYNCRMELPQYADSGSVKIPELGTRQLFRFATTKMQQRTKASETSDNATNFSLWEPRQRVLRQRDSNNDFIATT